MGGGGGGGGIRGYHTCFFAAGKVAGVSNFNGLAAAR